MAEVPLTPGQRVQAAGARVSSYGSAMVMSGDPGPSPKRIGFSPSDDDEALLEQLAHVSPFVPTVA